MSQAKMGKVAPREDVGCELRLEALHKAAWQRFSAVRQALIPLVERYETWIQEQANVAGLKLHQQDTATHLLENASRHAKRIERGIEALADDDIREAFAIANRVMEAAARPRFAVMQGQPIHDPSTPPSGWRPITLAFVF